MWEGIIVILFILFIILKIASSANEGESRSSERVAQSQFIKDNNVEIASQYVFESSNHSKGVRFVVDDKHKQILVSQNSSTMLKIPYSEIIGCEIIIDSEVAGGVGRAVVGGILAGGVGAIVGATTAKKHISSYQVIIYRENIQSPQYVIDLITVKTKTDDLDYKNAVRFATSVNSSIKAILSKERRDTGTETSSQRPNEKTASNVSVADELIKLKGLLDSGVLSQDEFDVQKQRLLSSGNEPVQVASETSYKVILSDFGRSKVTAIKEIRLTSGLGLAESKDVADNLPQPIVTNKTKNECEEIKSRFDAIGATSYVEPM